MVWTARGAIATVIWVTVPQRVRFSFEAPSLQAAVNAAGQLRQLDVGAVRVRPTRPCRMAGPYRWTILLTTAPLEVSRVAALDAEMQLAARRASEIRFTGWQFLDDPSEPLRVLIVDDSAPFRRAARELLERRGYSVVGEADGAASGLAAVERLRPGAVLLDVCLPDGSGFDVCAQLTREDDAPAVLLVSSDLYSDAALLKECGARAFVAKAELAQVDLDRIWGYHPKRVKRQSRLD